MIFLDNQISQCLVDLGLGKDVKRSDTINLEEEVLILTSSIISVLTSTKLNEKFGYFTMRIVFVIWGANEVRALNKFQFILIWDNFGNTWLTYFPLFISCFVFLINLSLFLLYCWKLYVCLFVDLFMAYLLSFCLLVVCIVTSC